MLPLSPFALSLCLQDQQCSLLYVQHTPSICQFLGLSVPPLHDNPDGSNTGTSRPETPTASTTPTPTAGKNNNSATVTTEGPAAEAGAGAGGEAAHLANVPSPRGSVGSKCSLAWQCVHNYLITLFLYLLFVFCSHSGSYPVRNILCGMRGHVRLLASPQATCATSLPAQQLGRALLCGNSLLRTRMQACKSFPLPIPLANQLGN